MPKKPRGKNKPDTRPESLLGMAQKETIIQLRFYGYSYVDIAKKVGVSHARCHKIVSDYMVHWRKTMIDDVGAVAIMDLEKIDSAIRILYEKIMTEADPKAANAMVHLLARKASMLGLDKAQKIDVTPRKAYVELSLDDWNKIKDQPV